jgi:hypothetical protein
VRPVSRDRTRQGDDERIGRLFDDTVLLGSPIGYRLARLDEYRQLCLAWYLGPGRADAAVAETRDGELLGYALACADEAAYRRWATRRVACFSVGTIGSLVALRLDRPSREFWWTRARDAAALRRARSSVPMPMHVHLNVAQGARSGSTAAALRDHLDQRCAVHDLPGWCGEMNARRGARTRALQRLGIEVVDAVPNHTLTRALGEPVDRLTIVRRLAH